MKLTKRVVALMVSLGMLLTPLAMTSQGPFGSYQSGPWDQPPREYRQDLQRRAFQDGLTGARRDLENRRRPNVNNRDEFRNYRGPAPRVYRDGFRRGYQTFWAHVRR